jgi:hypothetical protein
MLGLSNYDSSDEEEKEEQQEVGEYVRSPFIGGFKLIKTRHIPTVVKITTQTVRLT